MGEKTSARIILEACLFFYIKKSIIMEVIALLGDSSNGKSETINIVYQLMLLFGYVQVPGHFRQLGNPIQKDFIDVLEKKGNRVGLVSLGDYAPPHKDSLLIHLTILQSLGCKKAVCACSTRPLKIKSSISAFSPVFINKTACPEPEHRVRNGEDAERIYKLI